MEKQLKTEKEKSFNSDFSCVNPIKCISNQLSNESLFQMSWKVLMICSTKKVNIK